MRKFTVLFLFIFLPAWLFAKTAVIYHTSDVHGFFYNSHDSGGYAALASVLSKESRPYLLLDSGDFSNGAPEAAHSQGLKSLEMMNALKYDGATLGNHEFYFGDVALQAMLSKARFPFLAANLADVKMGKQPKNLFPYKVFSVDGVRVAVIGISSTQIKSSLYKLTDGMQSVRGALLALPGRKIKQQETDYASLSRQVRAHSRAQAVVLLVHNSPDNPYAGGKEFFGKLPQLFPGQIQVVLGGHLHQTRIRTSDDMLFVESGSGLKGVSRIELETDDKSGRFVSARASYIPLNALDGEDPAILALGDSLREPGLDEKLGTVAQTLKLWRANRAMVDSPLGEWMAGLFKEYTEADVFIHNIGAMRKDLDAGIITVRDLEELFPHDNHFVQMDVPGHFLRRLIESSLVVKPLYVFSGMDIVVRRTQSGVEIVSAFVNGQPLDEEKIYRVAANSYVAEGNKEGYLFRQIAPGSKRPFGTLSMRDVMIEGFKKYSPLRVPQTRSIRFE